jgi:hypothetical protein
MSTAAEWVKSSYSINGGQCVEVARVTGVMGIRDSKHVGGGPELWVSAVAARTFLAGVAQGTLHA